MALSQLGATALEQFNAANYDGSLEHLAKIRQQKDDDLKLEHNMAVAQYFQGGCSEPKLILEALSRMKSRIEESQNSNTSDTGVYVDEHDTSLLSYNEAVMYFQLKQHATSAAILEELFSNIEPIEEGLAVKIGFLLLENYWVLKSTGKALPVITFLEKIQDQAGGEASWMPNADKASVCREPIDMTSFELRLHMHKAQYHLLNQSFRSSKKEIKQALSASAHSPEAMLLKANFEFLRQNYRKSLKLLHSVSKTNLASAKPASDKPAPVSPLTPTIHNNVACIHFSVNNYNAALWYLSRALKAADQFAHQTAQGIGKEFKAGRVPVQMFAHCHKSEMLYNSGLQLLLTSRPQEAFTCFQEASAVLFHSPRLWLRLAECCLADHSMEAQRQSAQRDGDPLSSTTVDSGSHRKLLLPVTPISEMPPRVSVPDEDGNPTNTSSMAGAPVEAALTIEYAMHCARNAYYLSLPATKAEDAQGEAEANNSQASAAVAVAAAGAEGEGSLAEKNSESGGELVLVRVHALAILAYSALCDHSPQVGLQYAQKLLDECKTCHPNQFGELQLLAHMYAAEALVLLNRVSDAMNYVNPTAVGELMTLIQNAPPVSNVREAANTGGSDDEAEAARMPHPTHLYCSEGAEYNQPQMRCEMYVNMASVMAVQGDYGQTERFIQQAMLAKPGDNSALLLQIYVHLQRGQQEEALEALQKHRDSCHQHV